MIDTDCQLPCPAADAWSIDLTGLGGPRYVVPTTSEQHARAQLAQHLAELGKAQSVAAGKTIGEIPAERVAVLW